MDVDRGAVCYQTNLRGVRQNIDGQRFLDFLQFLFFDADIDAEYQYFLFLLDLLELVFHGPVLVVEFCGLSLLGYFSVGRGERLAHSAKRTRERFLVKVNWAKRV